MSFMYTTRDYSSQEEHMLLKRACLKWHIHWAAQSVRENCVCQAGNYTETCTVTHMHTHTHRCTYIHTGVKNRSVIKNAIYKDLLRWTIVNSSTFVRVISPNLFT